MTRFCLLSALALGLAMVVTAHNPISPAGVYIADPSAHVWDDGKIYIYGSVDQTTRDFCSPVHHVLHSDDLREWTLERNVFATTGENDAVPYNDHMLYAPDCYYKNGKYYLYYCQPGEHAEGVAQSKSPLGPFTDARPINVGGYNEIDPAVFIDDDGQAYYIWGQFTAKIAKLKPNMREIDIDSVHDSLVTEREHFFHEGGYMMKRNGIYYFIYAHMGRSNKPSCIGYATSSSPMGPFKYGGVIIDNDNCDPQNWNNHGSVVEFKGQWYVFYHRATHNSYMMRKACVEPIRFNSDGSIDEVEMTSQGAGKPLMADSKIEAEWACLLFGGTYIEAMSANEEKLTRIKSGNNVAYKYIEFSPDLRKFEVRVKSVRGSGKISLSIGQPWRQPFAQIDVPEAHTHTHTSGEWQTISADISAPLGTEALWLRFVSDEPDAEIEIDWFRFSK